MLTLSDLDRAPEGGHRIFSPWRPSPTALTFAAAAGTTYHIAVDSVGDALVDFELILSMFPPPANDAFAAAAVLSGAPAPVVVAAGTTSGATVEPGEPNHAVGQEPFGFPLELGPSVWYSWTAPTTGRVTLDVRTAISFGDTTILGTFAATAVYTGGSVDQLTLVANGAVPESALSHFRLEGANPREVVRVRGVSAGFPQPVVNVGTPEVKQVRTGFHTRPEGNELHVVVDLASPRVRLVQATSQDNRVELLLLPE